MSTNTTTSRPAPNGVNVPTLFATLDVSGSTVLKVATTAGPVWFKTNHGPLQHEAALVTLLAERVPDQVGRS